MSRSSIPFKIIYDHDGNELYREEREITDEELEAIGHFIMRDLELEVNRGSA